MSEAERALAANGGRTNFPTTTGILTAMTPSEARKLQQLAAGRRVLELGALHGYSTLNLAATAQEVWSVDWHFGDAQSKFSDTLDSWARNTTEVRRLGRVVALVGRFEQVLTLLRRESFGGVFHDGAHDERSVAFDLELALPLLAADGWFAAHDWGVYGVTDALLPRLGRPDRLVQSLAVWEHPVLL